MAVSRYSRAQFDLYQEMFDTFDADGPGPICESANPASAKSCSLLIVELTSLRSVKLVRKRGNRNHRAQEVCYPVHVALFTSSRPWENGVRQGCF